VAGPEKAERMNLSALLDDKAQTQKKPSASQMRWLSRGAGQAGGKLPLFDEDGQKIKSQTVRCCIENGWAEPWFSNPIKPDWLVCKLTEAGRSLVSVTKP
jgi:hypothetical protein